MIMLNIFKKNPVILLILSLIFFYFMDLGNPQALTQGTEGFYLQITKEMYEARSFLTPLYQGAPHWSKPPLHFWMPFPIYLLSGGFSLWAARICMVLFTLGGLFYISRWLARHSNLDKNLSFIFLLTTLAFFKYGRIYMMEMPLTLFSVCASLAFYDFLIFKKKAQFWFATILLACATLIKGPVALVMVGGAMGLTVIYLHLRKKENHWRSLILWGFFATLLASLWFIACYLKHGQQFIDYFFIRENMGKFTAKTYPITSLFNGLLAYSAPWVLFLPLALYHIFKRVHPLLDERRSSLLPFLAFHFLVFFLLWFIPTQRSYHYAVPSIPFFLMIILLGTFAPPSRVDEDDYSLRLTNIVWVITAFVTSLLVGLTIFVIAFAGSFMGTIGYFKALLALVILLFSLVTMIRKVSIEWKLASALWVIGAVWTLLIPIFFLPLVPNTVVQLIGKESLAVSYRKPFFVEEVLQRPIKVFDRSEAPKMLCKYNRIFMPEFVVEQHKLASKIEVLHRWTIWRRGNESADFFKAYQEKSLNSLQENMVLVKAKSCYKGKHEH